MVYKRFIKKKVNGRIVLYGPYEYSSKKENGKVVSTYIGKGNEKNTGKNIFSNSNLRIFGICFGLLLLCFLFFSIFNLTGHASLSLDKKYFPGEQIDSSVKLILSENEFIPASAKILIDNSGDVEEFLLSDLISETPVEGNYFIDGKNISGSGLGYGVSEEYPVVYFVMRIFAEGEDEIPENESVVFGGSEEEVEEPSEEEISEEAEETEEEIPEEIEEEEIIEEEIPEEQEVEAETEVEEIEETEEQVVEESEENVEEIVEEGIETEEVVTESASEETSSGESSSESAGTGSESSGESESISITGQIVRGIVGLSSKVFSGLTGFASLELVEEILGEVSVDEPYVYFLDEGQTAEILSSSENVEMTVENGEVIVTTDYAGDAEKEIEIDLSQLNLFIKQGEFAVSLVYDDEELASVSEKIDIIENGFEDFNITEPIEELNETIEEVVENESVVVSNVSAVIDTTQFGAVIGMPVQWKKKINLETPTNITVELPKQAEKIKVYKIEKNENSEIGTEGVEESEEEIIEQEFKEVNESVEEIEEQETEIIEEEINETENAEEIVEGVEEIPEEIESETEVAEVEEVVEKVEENVSRSLITGDVVIEMKLGKKSSGNFFKRILGAITGRVVEIEEKEDVLEVVIDENATEYEIEYETPAPVAFENLTSAGKQIIISSDVHYENILSYTELPQEVAKSEIRLYNIVNGSKVAVEFDAYDSEGNLIEDEINVSREIILEEKSVENKSVIYDENASDVSEDINVSVKDILNSTIGLNKVVENISIDNPELVSFITWVVPSLSNQTYELIIEVVKAEHLDENRTFVESIYDDVKAQDGNWSSAINDSHYVRVVFEQFLDSTKDITIYARGAENETADVEIYADNCSGYVEINGVNVSKEILAKKKRIDEIQEVLNG